MKKYLSRIGITTLILIISRLGYQAFFAYLSGHSYYISMLSSGQNRGIFISALLCSLFPLGYIFITSKVKVRKLIMWFMVGAGIFGLIHSNIKGNPIGIGHFITIFNTLLLVGLGIYLILGFSALGSRIERNWIKFKQLRWQEIFLSFGIGFCSFVIIVQILLGIGILYGVVSRILFLGLGFMIRYERAQLGKWGEIFGNMLDNFKTGIISGTRNLNSKNFWSGKNISSILILLPIILSVAYVYMGIQNAFVPYSTAWDANHEYMYIPKILAENAGIYRGNTIANSMPGFWHQFLTFIFSLTGCTNGRFGLSPDNIAISMNNISASLVLIFGIAIIFQIFTLTNEKKEKSELKKGKDSINETEISNENGITMGWYLLLLRLTSGMGAFLVIVDNKTDLGVMALSLLALLAGLIFLQNRKNSNNKKEILKYIIIAGLFFGFAALAKITAFVDLILFGLLLIGLRFSSLTSLGLGIIVMGFVRKFNILTSDVMLTDKNATWLIIIGGIITIVGLIVHLLKSSNRKEFWKNIKDLIILGICFIVPLIILKLPRTTISQIKNHNYSFSGSLKSVFLSINSQDIKPNANHKFIAQNSSINTNLFNSIEDSNTPEINNKITSSQLSFSQCSKIGNIYSEEELNENLEDAVGGRGQDDLGRYIGYGWKDFTETNLSNIDGDTSKTTWFKFFKAIRPKSNKCSGSSKNNSSICEKNLIYGIIKKLWPASKNCYGPNHDANILCSNGNVIDGFKIDELRTIYDNGINNKEGEAGLLLKQAIDAYDKAKSEGKLGFGRSNEAIFHDEIVNLRQYYQSHSILSNESTIYIPYRYLVPLNISFNRSLQNPSSYYTDTGFTWIIIYILLIAAITYAIIKKDKMLICISLTTLIGRGIRRIIGSAILRYGTVLISRTMITLAVFWNRILQNNNDNYIKITSYILIVLIGIFFGFQLLLNYIRISSQGASSVFVQYKGNVGSSQIISKDLQTTNKTVYGYGWKDIFDLQFTQYNPIINALADRKNEDGVIIAGTYIQYFLGNQWNIKSDQMLLDFRRNTSDGDLCKTYRRLKNDNSRYLIIDPNIGTVIMGEGNEALFYRFFGKLNNNKTTIETDGTITTLIKLAQAGYLKLISTNNLGARYAFTIDNNRLKNQFNITMSDEELILTRAKMAVIQYFSNETDILGAIYNIFIGRIINDPKEGIEDIASLYGLEINSKNVTNIALNYMQGKWNQNDIQNLTQSERNILINYLNLYRMYQQEPNKFQEVIQELLVNNLFYNGSQIIAVELN